MDTAMTTEVTAGTGAIDEEKRAWMPRVFCRSVNQFRKQDCRKAGAGAADEEEKALRLKACGVNAVVVLEGAAMSAAVVSEQEAAAKKPVVALAQMTAQLRFLKQHKFVVIAAAGNRGEPEPNIVALTAALHKENAQNSAMAAVAQVAVVKMEEADSLGGRRQLRR